MADDSGPNPMQAQLGLFAPTGAMSPVGIPTPMPAVRHPGEVSSSVVQQAQTQARYTMSAAGDASTQSYASQYQGNYAQLQSQLFSSPFSAQVAARLSGAPGMSPAMWPSPTQFTDPSLGIFRPSPTGPGAIIPPVPPLPFLRHPLVPAAPAPRFQTPFEYSYNYQQLAADQLSAAGLAAPGTIASAGVNYAGSLLGAGAGAALGGLAFGPAGARFGSALGAVGGLGLTVSSGLGQVAQRMVDRANPARLLAVRGAQMQGMSPDWLVGGDSLAPSGAGFSRSAAIHAGRLIEDLAYDSSFRAETGRSFSVRDVTQIARTAGQNGLLDFAQSPEATRDEVKRVAKQLHAFMQVANEPDVRSALKLMGNMRTMGLDPVEAAATTINARMFSRMGATSIRGLTETAGLPGALMAQQLGLSAGVGLQVGHGMYGLARQAVAGGAYSVQDLALLGGVQGIAQRSTESGLATLRMPMLAAATSTFSGGAWSLDPGAIQKMLSGTQSIEDLARAGAGNLHRGGVGSLGMFLLQQSQLQDSLGRALGPIGLKLLDTNNVLAAQKQLGFENSASGLFMAAKSLGKTDEAATQFVKEANSPAYFNNLRSQLQVQLREVKGLAHEARENARGGLYSRLSSTDGGLYGLDEEVHGLGTAFRSGLERVGIFLGEAGEDAKLPRGLTTLRANPFSVPTSGRQLRRLRAGLSSGSWQDPTLLTSFREEEESAPLFDGAFQYGRGRAFKRFRDDLLGGDVDQVSDYFRRRGGLLGAMPTALLRTANLLYGGTAFTGEGVREANRDYDAGASAIRRSLRKSHGERMEAELSLAKEQHLGDRELQTLVSRAAAPLVDQATRNRGRVFSTAALGQSDIDDALSRGVGDRPGLLADKRFRDLVIKRAHDLSDVRSAEAFSTEAVGSLDKDRYYGDQAAFVKTFDQGTAAFFGEADDHTRELLRKFQGESPETIALAGLSAATRQGLPGASGALDKYLQGLSPEARRRFQEEAEGLVEGTHDGALNKHLGALGARLAGRSGDLTAQVAGVLEQVKGASQNLTMRSGLASLHLEDDARRPLERMLSDPSFSSASALKALRGQKGLPAGLQRAVDTGDPNALEALLYDSGGGIASRTEGGDGGKAEEGLSNASAALTEQQRQLGANFPHAVDIFEKAARQLLQAAQAIGLNQVSKGWMDL